MHKLSAYIFNSDIYLAKSRIKMHALSQCFVSVLFIVAVSVTYTETVVMLNSISFERHV